MRILGHKLSVAAQIGLAIIALNIVVAVFAPLIAPYDQTTVLGDAWADPDPQHCLGLDNLGRDLLSRLIYGARMSIGLSLVITALSFGIGILSGFAAAVAGGWVDQALSRLVDLLLSMPTLIFAFVILSVLGSGLPVLIVTIAVLDSTRCFASRVLWRSASSASNTSRRRGCAAKAGGGSSRARSCRTPSRRSWPSSACASASRFCSSPL